MESSVISSIGGVIGLALGYGLIRVISNLADLPVVFSPQVVLVAVVFSLFVGIFFGMYPANELPDVQARVNKKRSKYHQEPESTEDAEAKYLLKRVDNLNQTVSRA